MKCLSLKQPFVDLLARRKNSRIKKIETKFRGKFLIHASKSIYREACERLNIDTDKFKVLVL